MRVCWVESYSLHPAVKEQDKKESGSLVGSQGGHEREVNFDTAVSHVFFFLHSQSQMWRTVSSGGGSGGGRRCWCWLYPMAANISGGQHFGFFIPGYPVTTYLAIVGVIALSLLALWELTAALEEVSVVVPARQVRQFALALAKDVLVVHDWDPALLGVVEFVFGAIFLDGDELVVQLGERDPVVLVEEAGVGRKRPVLGIVCHGCCRTGNAVGDL